MQRNVGEDTQLHNVQALVFPMLTHFIEIQTSVELPPALALTNMNKCGVSTERGCDY